MQSGRSSLILLVEDDRDIRESMRDALELAHYEVVTAVHGRDAFDRLHEIDRPSLILLDLMMPIMNGMEFLAELRRTAEFEALPVILLSAWPETTEQLRSQVQGVLPKPTHLQHLLDAVARFCSRSE